MVLNARVTEPHLDTGTYPLTQGSTHNQTLVSLTWPDYGSVQYTEETQTVPTTFLIHFTTVEGTKT